jgi:hypothetical protein
VSDKAENSRQFPGQHPGETVRFLFRQHPLVMRKQLFIGLFAILLAVLPLAFDVTYQYEWLVSVLIKVALGVPVVVLAFWFYRWIGWYYTMYIVTDQRLIEIRQRGLFDREVQEWQLNRVYNVNYRVGGLSAVMFGYGDIVAKTVIGEVVMPTIHRPTQIYHKLLEAVRAGGGGRDVGERMVDKEAGIL